MNKKYYIRNMPFGCFMFLCFFYLSWGDEFNYKYILLSVSIFGLVFYPVSKWIVESFILTFTTKEFWSRGLFMDTPGKMGGLAIYYGTVFLLSMPIITIFVFVIFMKRLLSK